MKKIFFIFLLISALSFGATIQDCRDAVINRGYTILREHRVTPDSGGELAMNFGASKNGEQYSIYVEVSSSGRVIVFDVMAYGF